MSTHSDYTDPEFWRLTDKFEESAPIIGPVLGDIVWFFDNWCHNWQDGSRQGGQQGSIVNVVLLATIADMLAVDETNNAKTIGK